MLDVDTAPMTSLTATYARFDSTKDYLRAGPVTQHYITGKELADILEAPGGVSVNAIDASVAKTGIPSAGILPDDLIYDPNLPVWRTEYYVKRLRETVKRLEEQALQPAQIPNPIPLPGIPTGGPIL